jgi:hypothetical protein
MSQPSFIPMMSCTEKILGDPRWTYPQENILRCPSAGPRMGTSLFDQTSRRSFRGTPIHHLDPGPRRYT